MIRTFTFFALLILLLSACTSGKKAMQQGNYDEAFYKAVNRLRSNGNHKKSREILSVTYPLAQKWHLERIRNLELTYERFKWEDISREYETLNQMYDELMRCPACLQNVVQPARYTSVYESAKLRAASERYEAGLAALEKARKGDREEGKQAFQHFSVTNSLVKSYKDTEERLKDAEFYSTIHVVVEPIPMHSRALKLSNEFFDNKINEFLLSAPVNRFVKFYTAPEAKKMGLSRPDQIIQLAFDDFVVGQTYIHEKESDLIRDSIVLATYEVDVPVGNRTAEGKVTICHKSPVNGQTETLAVGEADLKLHLDHGDKLGSCNGSTATRPGTSKETRKVYGKAKATTHIFTKTLESKGLLDFRILDGQTRRVLSQEKFPGVYLWQTQWGYFNGDERALDGTLLRIMKSKEVPPPAPQELFLEFTQPIYQQLTAKIRQFYKNY
ncbi:MAG TPA: hypothetical protein VGE15_06965 [Sphingobacteriaceae bacterium]